VPSLGPYKVSRNNEKTMKNFKTIAGDLAFLMAIAIFTATFMGCGDGISEIMTQEDLMEGIVPSFGDGVMTSLPEGYYGQVFACYDTPHTDRIQDPSNVLFENKNLKGYYDKWSGKVYLQKKDGEQNKIVIQCRGEEVQEVHYVAEAWEGRSSGSMKCYYIVDGCRNTENICFRYEQDGSSSTTFSPTTARRAELDSLCMGFQNFK